MAKPIDDTDLTILCILSDGKWYAVSDVVDNQGLHGKERQGALDVCRYRLFRLEEFGLLRSRDGPSIRKRVEFQIEPSKVFKVDNAFVVSGDKVVPLGGAIVVDNDIYSHEHDEI